MINLSFVFKSGAIGQQPSLFIGSLSFGKPFLPVQVKQQPVDLIQPPLPFFRIGDSAHCRDFGFRHATPLALDVLWTDARSVPYSNGNVGNNAELFRKRFVS